MGTSLIASVFVAALKLDKFEIALHVATSFEANLLQKGSVVISELI